MLRITPFHCHKSSSSAVPRSSSGLGRVYITYQPSTVAEGRARLRQSSPAREKLFGPTLFHQNFFASRFLLTHERAHDASEKIVTEFIARRQPTVFLEKVLQQFTFPLRVHRRFLIDEITGLGISIELLF